MHEHDSSRRRFFGYAALMAMAPMAAQQAFAQAKPAAAKALPKLPLDNPQAKALASAETTKGIAQGVQARQRLRELHAVQGCGRPGLRPLHPVPAALGRGEGLVLGLGQEGLIAPGP